MNLVDKRLRERFGDDYGISVPVSLIVTPE